MTDVISIANLIQDGTVVAREGSGRFATSTMPGPGQGTGRLDGGLDGGRDAAWRLEVAR